MVIEERAKEICDGMDLISRILFIAYTITGETIEDRTDKERDTIIKEAKHIVREGWNPTHFMIDKSLAEKRAIQEGLSI